ncbi:MAG: hypothetical protein J6K45_04495 [Clostridia bacterium]|nr:hypothetical protein [Clostridia bacterium]
MATFAQYILNEPDFVKKIEIASFLKKKQNTYFNTSVIMKAEIAREFMSTMKIDVDQNMVLTAALLYDCLKIDSPEEITRLQNSQEKYRRYLKALGFDDRFCKICAEHSRVGRNPNVPREKEGDILELAEQFGALLVHRSDRLAYSVPEALEILVNKNMKGIKNIYLEQFQEFVDIMEDIEIMHLGLLSRFQKDLNCVTRNDIPGAVREIYATMERNEEAFRKREAELRMGGNLLDELKKARAKLKLFQDAPLLPGFNLDDLK